MTDQGTGRRCVFCDREIAKGDPPEHVMPRWLRRLRPKGAVFSQGPGRVVTAGVLTPSPLPTFQSKEPDLTTDVVCKACNGSWMSDLETRASEFLSPMIEGEGQPLTVEDSLFVALWAVKTVMMWHSVEPSLQAIPLADHHWLHDKRTPPPLTQARVGQYGGDKLPFMGYAQGNLVRDIAEPPPPREPVFGGYRSILIIGQLVFEVFGSNDGEPVPVLFPDMTGPALVDIWPGLGSGYWPPNLAFDDEGIVRFLNPPAGSPISTRESSASALLAMLNAWYIP